MEEAELFTQPTLRWLRLIPLIALSALVLVVSPGSLHAQVSPITLISGNGAVGTLDPLNERSLDGGATWQQAHIITKHAFYGLIAGTKWIYCGSTLADSCGINITTRYRTTFTLPAGFTNPSLAIDVHADNAARIYLNGTQIGQQPGFGTCTNFTCPASNFDGLPDTFSTTDTNLFQVGANTLEIHVYDAGGISGLDYKATVSFTPDTTPPVVTAPAPLTVECNTTGGVLSTDPGIQAWLSSASAVDNIDGSLSVSHDLTAGLCAVGTTKTVTFSATDAAGNIGSATSTITVVDTTAPSISSVAATPNVLWPPNHKMVPVSVLLSVSDVCDASVSCSITSVTSNEPVDGLGDGDTSPDWSITGALTVDLRAERSGKGTGRVYTITVTCTDDSGNSSNSTVTVKVPRDKGK
jgi:hypothetical protein